MSMSLEELREFLEEKYQLFNQPGFIAADPVSVPHRYQAKADIEIAGFFAATIAWGRRDLITRAGHRLCDLMGESPYDFVMRADADDLTRLNGFVYRTFQNPDPGSLVLGLRAAYTHTGGLEGLLSPRAGEADTYAGICRLHDFLVAQEGFAAHTRKHVANPATGSSAKRLNMYLRWMVRDDGRGVDFGLWKGATPAQLICPLDVHTGNISRKLGLLTRKQNDWRAAVEMTDALRRMDPVDPVRYDFSLFGLGIFEQF
jgi:uncharacterized protein (TIGR02757 family)